MSFDRSDASLFECYEIKPLGYWVYVAILQDEYFTDSKKSFSVPIEFPKEKRNVSSFFKSIGEFVSDPDNASFIPTIITNLINSSPRAHQRGGGMSVPVDTTIVDSVKAKADTQIAKQKENVMYRRVDKINIDDIEDVKNSLEARRIVSSITTPYRHSQYTKAWILTSQSPEDVQENGIVGDDVLMFTNRKTASNFLTKVLLRSSLATDKWLSDPIYQEAKKVKKVLKIKDENWSMGMLLPVQQALESTIFLKKSLKEEQALQKKLSANETELIDHQVNVLHDALANFLKFVSQASVKKPEPAEEENVIKLLTEDELVNTANLKEKEPKLTGTENLKNLVNAIHDYYSVVYVPMLVHPDEIKTEFMNLGNELHKLVTDFISPSVKLELEAQVSPKMKY